MRMELSKIMKKIFALILAAAFLIGPAAIGRTTAAAQEYYPDDRYGGYPPNSGYAPADPGYPSDRGYPPPPNQGYPQPPDRGYGPPPSGYADYRLSPEQLENLLAPVALYPDPILAQILVAATYVDQVQDASGWMQRYNDPYGVDNQPWDISVKAIAHYPSVLSMMADRPDWTTALGQAYIEQPADVSAAIQHLRWMAQRAGNLVTNDYWEVVPTGGFIEIYPVQPRFIYLPVYDPAVVFVSPFTFVFGPAFAIGPWLNCDWDWHGHRIYYHGWHGPRWVERSRPYVRLTNVYVNNRFRNVRVNRDIVRRSVNVQNLNRFTSVHRDANFATLERRNNFLRERGNALANDRRGQDRGRAENFRSRQSPDSLRGRQGANQPPTRDDRGARLRQDRQAPSFQNPPTGRDERLRQGREDRSARPGQNRPPENFRDSTRDERLRQQREDRSARLREDRQPGALDNPARRNRDNRGPAVENRQQPRDRSQALEDRSQQLREQNRQRFLENRPPQNFENRGQRFRDERPQGLENPGERGRQERPKQQVSAPPQTAPARTSGPAPRGERRIEAQGRERVQAATPNAGQQNRTNNAHGSENAHRQQERREIAG